MIYLSLIPKNIWYINLRTMLSVDEWNIISKRIRVEQEYTCFCCKVSLNELKSTKYFHAHEMWWFDDTKKIVDLKAILCVCWKCHESMHLGFASVKNNYKQAFGHLMKVNKWNYETANIYVESSFEKWSQNSNIDWKFNISSFENILTEQEIMKVKKYLISKNLII